MVWQQERIITHREEASSAGNRAGVQVPDPAIAKPITIKRAKINRNCLLLLPNPKPNLSRSPPEIPIHLHLRLQFADDLRLRFFLFLGSTTWLENLQVTKRGSGQQTKLVQRDYRFSITDAASVRLSSLVFVWSSNFRAELQLAQKSFSN